MARAVHRFQRKLLALALKQKHVLLVFREVARSLPKLISIDVRRHNLLEPTIPVFGLDYLINNSNSVLHQKRGNVNVP